MASDSLGERRELVDVVELAACEPEDVGDVLNDDLAGSDERVDLSDAALRVGLEQVDEFVVLGDFEPTAVCTAVLGQSGDARVGRGELGAGSTQSCRRRRYSSSVLPPLHVAVDVDRQDRCLSQLYGFSLIINITIRLQIERKSKNMRNMQF
ncbi:hypothetical protein [Brevibacterium atlanticum]|uniref:hypothetical protein n=1 Tax=Brevibacterium atlanticum TaxID=2697563 RepID=UPI00141EA60A|nr:hypothetical protein [Brevibacterium atlanticum]